MTEILVFFKLLDMGSSPLFAIGDIHGCAPELHTLLADLPLTKDSTIVFLGDYVDRGNFSSEVIETIIKLSKQYNVVALKGNHEEMFLDFLRDRSSAGATDFILNGGSSTLVNYADMDGSYKLPEDHLSFLRQTKLYYETEKFFFVHAGLPAKPLKEIDFEKEARVLTWIRQPFTTVDYDYGKIIVHGHSRVKEVNISKYRIAVDTGCVHGNKLSAIELNSMRTFSVEKKVKNQPRVYLRDKVSKRVAERFDGNIRVLIVKEGKSLRFDTLNYNEFGLLISEPSISGIHNLNENEKVIGLIGNQDHSILEFRGQVVRKEYRPGLFLYGIKLEKVSEYSPPA